MRGKYVRKELVSVSMENECRCVNYNHFKILTGMHTSEHNHYIFPILVSHDIP